MLAGAIALALLMLIPDSSRRAPNASEDRAGGRGFARHPASPRAAARSRFMVGVQELRFVDHSRTVDLPSGPAPRTLVTVIRYPAVGQPRTEDVPNAPAAGGEGPFPLIVFGHGFDVTPALYAPLLHAWAEAGYVVAAPVFPRENADAPGGADEADLPNQPGDMSFVISQVLARSRASQGTLAGLVDPAQIAATGQSDGGDTALAVAYDSSYKDARVKAAVILSGAEMPGVSAPSFAAGEPPLLATQGSADPVNPPQLTRTFFEAAAPPKYLLELPGAEHLPPYSQPGPALTAVERVTIAFLDAYLKQRAGALARMKAAGHVAGVAELTADP